MADESLKTEQEAEKVATEQEVNPDGIGTPGDTSSKVDEAGESKGDPVEGDDEGEEGEEVA